MACTSFKWVQGFLPAGALPPPSPSASPTSPSLRPSLPCAQSGLGGGGETPVSSAARPGDGAEGPEAGRGGGRRVQGPGDADTGDPSEHFNSELAGLLLRQHELEGSGGAGSGAPGAVPDMDDGDTDDILKLIADMGGGGAPFLESDWKLGQVKE